MVYVLTRRGCWCRILMGRMFLSASLRGRFSWLLMLLPNGTYSHLNDDLQLCIVVFTLKFIFCFLSFKARSLYHYHSSLWYNWIFLFISKSQWSDEFKLLGTVSHIREVQNSRYANYWRIVPRFCFFLYLGIWQLRPSSATTINVSGCWLLEICPSI